MSWNLSTEVQIKKLADGLHVGSSRYVKCIFCNAEHEHKLSLTRVEEGILYHCFRAKCGAKGIIIDNKDIARFKILKDEFKPRVFIKPLSIVPHDLQEHIFNTTGLNLLQIRGVDFSVEDNAIVFNIYNNVGMGTGKILKNRSTDKPKYITYMEIYNPHSYYLKEVKSSYPLVIVEDILSALKVYKFANSMALLGTNLTSQGLKDILEINPTNILIMLDPGAEDKAMKIANKLSPFFEVRVVYNDKDPKYIEFSILETMIK